jgi:hypothetical protein
MYKLIVIILLAFGTIAFGQNKGKTAHTVKNSNAKSLTQGKSAHQSKGSAYKGNNHGNKSRQTNQPKYGKQNKGSHRPGKQVSKKQSNVNKGHRKKKYTVKGHPNYNYAYNNKHGYYSHKNYGQWRSEQARNKHRLYHPIYEYQAIEGFHLLNTRNTFLYRETDYKINLLDTRLANKRKANQITVVQYDAYNHQIEVLQRRRLALDINISL